MLQFADLLNFSEVAKMASRSAKNEGKESAMNKTARYEVQLSLQVKVRPRFLCIKEFNPDFLEFFAFLTNDESVCLTFASLQVHHIYLHWLPHNYCL